KQAKRAQTGSNPIRIPTTPSAPSKTPAQARAALPRQQSENTPTVARDGPCEARRSVASCPQGGEQPASSVSHRRYQPPPTGRLRISPPDSKNSPSARGSTAWRPPGATWPRWRARPPEPRGGRRDRVTSREPPQRASAASPADVVVDVRGVHYALGGRPIFSNLDVQVRRGRITAIMGPSGTGKTTLLKLITAQVPPDQGELRVFGQDLAILGRREVYDLRR